METRLIGIVLSNNSKATLLGLIIMGLLLLLAGTYYYTPWFLYYGINGRALQVSLILLFLALNVARTMACTLI